MGSESPIDLGARLSGATTDIASRVTGAIREAARVTGAGFEYLLTTAARESNFDPNAKSPNSSATGLFQFLDQTWLATLKNAGPSLGYGKYADAITQNASGSYSVSDPAMLREIMELRKDPTASAVMGAAFANENAKTLTERLGRKPTDGELYIAHFLGASGAVRLISAAQTQPNTSAASLFPKAAAANAPIFYDRKTGAARSVSDVYKVLVSRHDGATTRLAATPGTVVSGGPFAPRPSAPVATISAPIAATAARVPTAPPLVTAAANIAVPATTPNFVEINTPIAQRAVGPMFHGLYNDGNRGAVAPVVRQLWGVRHGMPSETAAAVAPTAPAPGATETPSRPPMSLFQFLRPDARAGAA
jgi:hypothetical protein